MIGNLTWEQIFALLTLAGFVSAVWRRLEGKIKEAEETASLRALAAQAKAETATADLSAYKLHVAETYASKDGVDRQFEAVSKSITEFGTRMEQRLDGVNERLDRVIEASGKPVRSAH